MIVKTAPSFDLIDKEQIKFIDSLKIDVRMTPIEIVESIGLSFIEAENEVGGFFSSDEKEIGVGADYIESDHIKTILSHELSHFVQHQTRDFNYNTMLNCIQYEQQCESISRFLLMPKLFPGEKQSYISYFDSKDWKWMKQYYLEQNYDIEDDLSEMMFSYKKKLF